ncbi:PAS domain-containing protein [Dyadobacter sp. CY345]|uniref:PAS domain-containing sensor histidine kinase n=1 Tax=Dyadobacter sp. CY345 TaxID=2909335 RepID=UPI001F30DF1F|nr:PAS domain-containing protein [Dyadobacter sp. CY345]MCF2444114.1 PAS domain-containing protein [Dyadobacter sp. CY345]
MNDKKSSVNDRLLLQERFDLVAKATHDVIRDWDLEKKTLWWNDVMESLFGYITEDLEPGPDSWYNRIHPEDQERVITSIHKLIEKKESNWSEHYRFRRADGSYAFVHDRGYTIIDGGKPVRMVASMQDTSEQVLMQKALEESEARLLFALSSAQLFTWDIDTQNQIVHWGEGTQRLHGFTNAQSVPSTQMLENAHPEDRDRLTEAVNRALTRDSGGYFDIEYRICDPKSNSLRWIHSSGQAYFGTDNKPYRFSGVTKDITDQVLSREKAAIADHQASIAIEGFGAGSFVLDLATNEITYSPTFVRILTGTEFVAKSGKVFVDHIHRDDLPFRDEALALLRKTGVLSYEARFIWQDGSEHWVRVIGKNLVDASGKAITLSGIVLDITDSVEAEKKLSESEAKLRTLMGKAPVAIGLLKGENFIIEEANPCILQVWGKDESVIGMPLIEGLPELAGQAYPEILANVYNSGVPYHGLESRVELIRNGQKEDVYFNFVYTPLFESETVTGIIIVASEITEQVQTKLKIAESERKFRNLIEEAPIAICLFKGRDLIIENPNDAILKIFGKGNDVAGKKLADVLPELLDQPFMQILDDVYTTGIAYHSDAARADLVIDGVMKTFYFDFTYQPLRNENGVIYAIVDIAIDVTSQIEYRTMLEKSQDKYRQLASELENRVQKSTNELRKANHDLTLSNANLQQFAYAASHDMQEPLRKIQAFSSRLQTQYEDVLDDTGVFMLNRMQDAGKRMSAMIDDLLAYSRLSTRDGEFAVVNMNRVVAEVLSDLEIVVQESGAHIITGELIPVWGNARQFAQLFQNIISNAVKYRNHEQKPIIQIRSSRVSQTDSEISSDLSPEQSYVKIEIEDNGIGFNMDNLDRIFQMFQRLHGRSEYSGSGIGLALCRKVVQNHNGYLTAVSEEGRGATFIIYLPEQNG